MSTSRRVTYRRVIVPHGTSWRAQFLIVWCWLSAITALGLGLGWVLAQWIIAGR